MILNSIGPSSRSFGKDILEVFAQKLMNQKVMNQKVWAVVVA